jgi:hypothetical protein
VTVEWNPQGDVWEPADLLEQRDTGHAVIRLRDNGQVLLVEQRHLRVPPAPGHEAAPGS